MASPPGDRVNQGCLSIGYVKCVCQEGMSRASIGNAITIKDVILLPPPRILGPSNKETFSHAGPNGINGRITPEVADCARSRYNCSENDEGLPAAIEASVHCKMAAAMAPPL